MGKIIGCYVMPHPPIIIPEVGKGEENRANLTYASCTNVGREIRELKPDTIIVITPHGPMFRDAIAIADVNEIKGDLGKFGVPGVKLNLKIDKETTGRIIELSDKERIQIAPITENSRREYNISNELDHGAFVPLYFINREYQKYKLVHITYGLLSKIDLYRFGMIIQKTIEEGKGNAVIIGSGDLSHRLSDDGPYDYNPMGEVFDRQIVDLLERGDTIGVFGMEKQVVDSAGECGLRSFYILLGALDGKDIKGRTLSYEGPFGVGYGVMSFDFKYNPEKRYLDRLIKLKETQMHEKRQSEDIYVRLARESLENFLRYGEYIKIPDYAEDEMLKRKRGVFVSLKKEGELRGCIGTIFPATENIALEIIRNTVEAGERDPRFSPVEEDELDDIEYSVDVLTEPESASRQELDPKKYGVIVRRGQRAGLLLPDLEGVDTVDEQLKIALNKAGIDPGEDYSIEKFEVIRHR